MDKDTTDVLQGRVSVVLVYSGQWAQRQTDSFLSEAQNPELVRLLKAQPRLIQKVEINVEETRGRAALVWMFVRRLRNIRMSEDWGRYFVVRRGLTEDVRTHMGFVNGKVGYVYLVDWDCRIRWAASGEAEGGEKEGMVASARRLLDAFKKEGETDKARRYVKRVRPQEQAEKIVAPANA